MAFQEELKFQLAELVPEDKRAEFEEKTAGIFDKMGQVFARQAEDMAAMKKQADLAKRSSLSDEGKSQFDELQKKLAERESAYDELSSKYSEVTGKHTKAEKMAKELSDKLSGESQAYSELVKQSELRKAIGQLSLTEGTGDEVFALLASNVKVKVGDKGERRVVALVPDTDGKLIEKSTTDYVKDWAANSPLAKRVLAAARNTGGGAQGGPGSIGGPATIEQQYADAAKRGDITAMISLKEQARRQS
jgi:predicted nuclease with TOPRIM domain